MEIVVANLRGRALWLGEALAVVLALAAVALLIAGTWDNFANAWSKGDSSMDVNLQLWPSKLVVPLALAVLLARLVLQLWAYLRLLADPARPEIAVPRHETPEQAAQREAEEAIGKVERG
jgi:TRAP-type C4-dicarboxylate transport system permease small subunit